jgi:2-polyprenyl-6-methoxyphenol hydroxylase-like FAD-dependent oxidoreductase
VLRAIVVGAGPAGLATAIALRREGIEPVVYERAGDEGHVGVGLTLWPNAFKALAAIGAADAVRAVAQPAEGIVIRSARGRLLDETPRAALEARFAESGVALTRAALIDALSGLLDGEIVTRHARCVGVRQERDHVGAVLADGREAAGDVLVGADGFRSVVRHSLSLGGRLRYAGYPVWRAVTAFDLGRAPGTLSFGPGAQFGTFPLPGGRTYWFATFAAPAGSRVGRSAHKPELRERFGAWHDPIPALLEAAEECEILVTDIFDARPLRRWSRGRATLVGDAAHPSTPTMGQGTSQAFEDAVVLARSLGRCDDVARALAAYEAERRRRANGMVLQARRMGRIGLWKSAPACWFREQLFVRMPRRSRLRQLERLFAFEAAPEAG